MTTTHDNAQSCSFGPLRIGYDAAVLVPRQWTLLQSEWAAELATGDGPLLELCAGAGHIGLAAAVLAGRDLVQVEADEHAASWARRNADAAGWSARTDVRCALVDKALGPDERFDLVLADPPYLPTAEIDRWPEDPVRAIDGGTDGLHVVRACLRTAADHLRPGGTLLLQTAGREQALHADGVDVRLRLGEIREHDAERAVARFDTTPTPW